MSYTNDSGRRRILEDTAVAGASLSFAMTILGDAYEYLDEQTADRMEDAIFRPIQQAYGLLKRTRVEFAARYGLTVPDERVPTLGPTKDPRQMIERAGDAAHAADEAIAELQDTLLPVEVGDQPLRAGLSQVRTLIDPIVDASGQFLRTYGR